MQSDFQVFTGCKLRGGERKPRCAERKSCTACRIKPDIGLAQFSAQHIFFGWLIGCCNFRPDFRPANRFNLSPHAPPKHTSSIFIHFLAITPSAFYVCFCVVGCFFSLDRVVVRFDPQIYLNHRSAIRSALRCDPCRDPFSINMHHAENRFSIPLLYCSFSPLSWPNNITPWSQQMLSFLTGVQRYTCINCPVQHEKRHACGILPCFDGCKVCGKPDHILSSMVICKKEQEKPKAPSVAVLCPLTRRSSRTHTHSGWITSGIKVPKVINLDIRLHLAESFRAMEEAPLAAKFCAV